MSSTSNILANNEPSGDDTGGALKSNDREGVSFPPTTADPKPANDATKSNCKENVAVAAATNNNGNNTQQHHAPTAVAKATTTSAAAASVSQPSQGKRKRDDLSLPPPPPPPPQHQASGGINNDSTTTTNGNQKDDGKLPGGQPKNTKMNPEELDRQRADRFASIVRQQFDPTQRDAANKVADYYEKDQLTSESLNILTQTRKDLEGVIKLMKVAEQDVILQLQEQKEQWRGYYYKKPKKSRYLTDFIDPDLGCQESLPGPNVDEGNDDGGKKKNNETRNRIIQTAQETAILREATRLVRKQARELCKRRIRSTAVASKPTASKSNASAASKSTNAASKSNANAASK